MDEQILVWEKIIASGIDNILAFNTRVISDLSESVQKIRYRSRKVGKSRKGKIDTQLKKLYEELTRVVEETLALPKEYYICESHSCEIEKPLNDPKSCATCNANRPDQKLFYCDKCLKDHKCLPLKRTNKKRKIEK